MNKMRIRYYIYIEKPGDEAHEHDLIKGNGYDKLEDAKKELITITDRYARIEKHTEEYTPPPFGKVWRKPEYGWSTEDFEVVEEN